MERTSVATASVVPYLMRARPVDPRGFATPWIVDRDDPGEVDFRVLNPNRVKAAIDGRLCAMCGQRMGRYIYFIGGPLSYRNKVFNHPAMHESCARYALVACPHLSRPNTTYSKRPADGNVDHSVVQDRPTLFGLMKATGQKIQMHRVAGVPVAHIAPDMWFNVTWFDATKPMAVQVTQMPKARE